MSIKKILNKMVSYERKRQGYFELGECIDLCINQIPYIHLKNTLSDKKKWEFNSLKLSDDYITSGALKLQYRKKANVVVTKPYERRFLYPINIICQLIDFLFLYQNKKVFFKEKVRVVLEYDERYSICKIFTKIKSSDHWFGAKKDKKVADLVHQYTSAINFHSNFVNVERLNHEGKCFIVIKFDLLEYHEEEKKILEMFALKIGVQSAAKFKRNINHVLYCSTENDFIKIVDSSIIADKKNSLYSEFMFINKLKDFHGFLRVKEYTKVGNYEIFITNKIQGKTIDEYLLIKDNDIETALLFKLFDQARKLKHNYIIHRDLKGSNIIISPTGEIFIIDFDQAMINMDLHNKGNVKLSYYSSTSPFFTLGSILNKIPKVRNKIQNIQTRVGKVWQEAAKSNSNSPGVEIAYYSYDFGDIDYPGERDFFDRWLLLEKNHISLNGKIVVELGCNLGLFGAYSALYGAEYVTCFDIDNKIIECARELTDIMELKNIRHEVRDLNIKGTFKDLEKIDFIFALSVYFWLKDTTEFNRLMGLAKEMLYEGHEQFDIENERLKQWGFVDIKTIGISERLRTIFYAKK